MTATYAPADPAPTGRPRGFRALVATSAMIGALFLVGNSVFAALNATASNPSAHTITSGTLKLALTNNGVGFGTTISDMAPGDQVRRFVTLQNNGTLEGKDLALAASVGAGSKLTTDGTYGLKLTIDSCSVAWDASTNTCGGTTTSRLASTSFLTLIGATAPGTTLSGFSSITAGQSIYLRFTFLLPDQAETTVNGVLPSGTIQGLTAAMTWTFNEVQRTATDTTA